MTFKRWQDKPLYGLTGGEADICEVVDVLREHYGGVAQLGLDDPAKEFLQQCLGVPCDALWGPQRASLNAWHPERPWDKASAAMTLHGPSWLRGLGVDLYDLESGVALLLKWLQDFENEKETLGGDVDWLLRTLKSVVDSLYQGDLWLDYSLRRSDALLRLDSVRACCITDVRSLFQAQQIKQKGGAIWSIWRIQEYPAVIPALPASLLPDDPSSLSLVDLHIPLDRHSPSRRVFITKNTKKW